MSFRWESDKVVLRVTAHVPEIALQPLWMERPKSAAAAWPPAGAGEVDPWT